MKTPEVVKSSYNSSKEAIVEVVSRHSNFFMIVASALILITGIGIAQGQANWWISSVAILGFFLLIFVLINARVMIKTTLAFITAVFVSNFALQAGAYLSPYSALGIVWLSSQLFLFFFCVSISYLAIGYRSRWTGVIISQIVSFFIGLSIVEFMNPNLGIGISILSGIAAFVFYYRTATRFSHKSELMPANHISEKMDTAVENNTLADGWEARKLTTVSWRKKTEISDYLVWNEEYAFILHPIDLDNKLSISPGRRSTSLVYKGQSINPWLLRLINKRIPVWKSKNASIMLILLDISNKNGTKPEAIGVSIPDTKKKIPVGIYPGKRFFNTQGNKKSSEVLKDIVKNYSVYTSPLTEKQKKAMAEIGVHESSSYLEETETVEQEETAVEKKTAEKA